MIRIRYKMYYMHIDICFLCFNFALKCKQYFINVMNLSPLDSSNILLIYYLMPYSVLFLPILCLSFYYYIVNCVFKKYLYTKVRFEKYLYINSRMKDK